MPLWRNIGGTWKVCTPWRNIGGTWKPTTLWRNIGGTWKPISVLFTPDGGTVVDNESVPGPASVTLSCAVPAVWTYGTLGSGVTASIASGATASSIRFSFSLGAGSGSRTILATGVAAGITRNFTVELTLD